MRRVNIFVTGDLGRTSAGFEGHQTSFTFSRLGPDGPVTLADGPIWAFVDWVMPELSGLEMVRRLRADRQMSDAHITLILDADNAEDRRRALKAGADDYMLGPADRTGILDRVLALYSLRGPATRAHHVHTVGPLSIDAGAVQARWMGTPINLRPNEFRLLRFLAGNPGQVMSRTSLIEGLGKGDAPLDERTVDVWIGRLRQSLRKAGAGEPLRTVRSRGYALDLD